MENTRYLGELFVGLNVALAIGRDPHNITGYCVDFDGHEAGKVSNVAIDRYRERDRPYRSESEALSEQPGVGFFGFEVDLVSSDLDSFLPCDFDIAARAEYTEQREYDE